MCSSKILTGIFIKVNEFFENFIITYFKLPLYAEKHHEIFHDAYTVDKKIFSL